MRLLRSQWWIVKTFYICSDEAISTIFSTVAFHPVSLANGLLDTISGIGWPGPTPPSIKRPPNAVSHGSRAIELAKLRVKTLLLVIPTLV